MAPPLSSRPPLPDLPGLCLAITERAPLPMATLEGVSHIVRYGNQAFCRLVGRKLGQFVGRPLDELLPRKDMCLTLLERVYRTKKPESFTERAAAKPHPIFWSYTIWPVAAPHSLVNLMIQVTETAKVHDSAVAMNEALILGSVRQHELTEAAEKLSARLQTELVWRQHAETILRRNEALFAALIDQSPVGVYVVDARMRLQRLNSRARPLFKNVRPLLGRALPAVIQRLWRPAVARRMVRCFRHTLRTGEPCQTEELAERRRDTGAEEIHDWQIQRVTLPDGEHGVVCFFNDITKRKRAELAQRRLAVLTAANKQANREIARRRLVEAFLRESEQSQTRLLAESRELHGQLRHLTRQIITAQEEERKKISRELHDDVMQTLVGINSALANLAGEGSSVAPSDLGLKIARTQRLVKESLLAVRQFARDLRPSVLDDFGLVAALQAYTEGLAAKEKFRVTLTTSGDLEPLDNIRRTVLFRVAQEALTNVARHAHASAVALRVTAIPGTVRMEVRDNGRSFPVQATLAPGKNQRLGLLGMRERVEMIGGTLLIKSAPGRGTLLCAEIPFSPPDATG